ncbi:MAG: hypothetical protein MZW92_10085 [Comamonadaceae bacterium]|nr:hypothetical protein [Comamonadaceae bacterium]
MVLGRPARPSPTRRMLDLLDVTERRTRPARTSDRGSWPRDDGRPGPGARPDRNAGETVLQAPRRRARRRRPVGSSRIAFAGRDGLVLVARPLRPDDRGRGVAGPARPRPGEPHRRPAGLADVPPRAGRPAGRAARLLRHQGHRGPGRRPDDRAGASAVVVTAAETSRSGW